MIIILEGFNGTGKTTAAKALRGKYGFKIYRPLRENHSDHFRDPSSPVVSQLRACRVPFNSYFDDVFAADALVQIRPEGGVVMDRSMPTALAYGLTKGEIKGRAHREALESYWIRRLKQLNDTGIPVAYVWLVAAHDKAQARSHGEHYPAGASLAAMDDSFARSFDLAKAAGFKCLKINTNTRQSMLEIEKILPGETKKCTPK